MSIRGQFIALIVLALVLAILLVLALNGLIDASVSSIDATASAGAEMFHAQLTAQAGGLVP